MPSAAQFLRRRHQHVYDTLPPTRADIQYKVDVYFAEHVHVDERAFQALEFAPENPAFRREVLWRTALMLQPALASLIEQSFGSDLSYARFVSWLDQYRTVAYRPELGRKAIRQTLHSAFRLHGTPRGRNAHAKRVQDAGRLAVADFLLAALEPPLTARYSVPLLRFALTTAPGRFAGPSVEGDRWLATFTRRLRQSLVAFRRAEPDIGEQQFFLSLGRDGVSIRPCGTWSYCQAPQGGGRALRCSVIQPAGPFSADALRLLEDLVNGDAAEGLFQCFFEQHPEFLQSLGAYRRVYPHVILEQDTGVRLIPDFFLETLDGGFADICDLKRATQALVKEREHRPRFRDQVMAGVRQLADYRNFFEDRANRAAFAARYPHLRAFRPRVILIIGRATHFSHEIERVTLESELPGWLTIKTYDDVIAAARLWRGMWNGPTRACS